MNTTTIRSGRTNSTVAQSQAATPGMLIAMPTVVVIALLDGLVPGHFNLAVLYVVPLVTCAWARNLRLLWTMCLLLEVLAIGGLYWAPAPTSKSLFSNSCKAGFSTAG